MSTTALTWTMLKARAEKAEATLAVLVRLKDIKERIDRAEASVAEREIYRTSKAGAWHAARALVGHVHQSTSLAVSAETPALATPDTLAAGGTNSRLCDLLRFSPPDVLPRVAKNAAATIERLLRHVAGSALVQEGISKGCPTCLEIAALAKNPNPAVEGTESAREGMSAHRTTSTATAGVGPHREALTGLREAAQAVADSAEARLSLHTPWPELDALNAALRGTCEERPERTPSQYAIEHAGYLATAATQFLGAANALHDAQIRAEAEEAGDETFESLQRAKEDYSDHFGALKSAVYEFEKRRDRVPSTERHDG
jgi:hypothetical protein